jgi:hypothetical protein
MKHRVAKVQGGDVPKGRDAHTTARKGGNKLSRPSQIGETRQNFKRAAFAICAIVYDISDEVRSSIA